MRTGLLFHLHHYSPHLFCRHHDSPQSFVSAITLPTRLGVVYLEGPSGLCFIYDRCLHQCSRLIFRQNKGIWLELLIATAILSTCGISLSSSLTPRALWALPARSPTCLTTLAALTRPNVCERAFGEANMCFACYEIRGLKAVLRFS